LQEYELTMIRLVARHYCELLMDRDSFGYTLSIMDYRHDPKNIYDDLPRSCRWIL